jgi:transcriptional regulator with PAS, ATPase and Fis domain
MNQGERRSDQASSADKPSEPVSADGLPDFRWQGIFQRASEPLFLLNRQWRILFVNRAWEALTGLTLSQVRGLACRRKFRDAEPGTPEAFQYMLAPPAEVVDGSPAKVRRLLASAAAAPVWWDLSFFPLKEANELMAVLGKVTPVSPEGFFATSPLPERIVALRQRRAAEYRLDRLASDHPGMRRVVEQIRLMARTRSPVLVAGEPGTGKEWVARTLHQESPGREGGFAAVDCRRLPAAALTEILDAPSTRLLRPGTIYLREPAYLPRELQARLADLLGRTTEESAGPRIMAGMSADPDEEVQSSRLLPDLYCKLSPVTIALPPLRERLDDLGRLLTELLPRAAAAAGREVKAITPTTLELLRSYSWPGNLRELYHVLVGACLHAEGDQLEPAHLPFYLRPASPTGQRSLPLDSLLEQVERRLILLALRLADNNRTRAAEILAVWRPRLLRRLEALGSSSSGEEKSEPDA